MKRRLFWVLGIMALMTLVTWAAVSVNCPVDQSAAYFTGITATDKITGKLLQKYQCPRGHEFWVPVN